MPQDKFYYEANWRNSIYRPLRRTACTERSRSVQGSVRLSSFRQWSIVNGQTDNSYIRH